MDWKQTRKLGEELYAQLHLPTWPVGITYLKKTADIPEKPLRPSAIGQKWSRCQAFTCQTPRPAGSMRSPRHIAAMTAFFS